MLDEVLKKYVCSRKYLLDLGTGSGRSLKHTLKVCSNDYVVGIDLSYDRLHRAKSLIKEGLYDLICCNASHLPIRDLSLGAVTSFLILHEVEEELVGEVLNEVRRVLKIGSHFIVIDKYSFKPETPAEELTLLTEEAYHKALHYALGIKVWGIKEVDELITTIEKHGFKVVLKEEVEVGKHLNGEEFLKTWGKETIKLTQSINDEAKKKELENLINKIRKIGIKYGYGPARAIFIVARK